MEYQSKSSRIDWYSARALSDFISSVVLWKNVLFHNLSGRLFNIYCFYHGINLCPNIFCFHLAQLPFGSTRTLCCLYSVESISELNFHWNLLQQIEFDVILGSRPLQLVPLFHILYNLLFGSSSQELYSWNLSSLIETSVAHKKLPITDVSLTNFNSNETIFYPV